jgi:hypothetical protein
MECDVAMSIEQRGRVRPHRSVAISVVVLILIVTGVELAYRKAYGTFAWWEDPARISWCGRQYFPTSAALLTRAAAEQQRGALPGDAPYPVVEVARVPPLVGRTVLASVTPEERRERLGVPCAMAIFVQTDSDAYRTYVISGGP